MRELMFYDRCFWCLEDFFSYIDGVIATEVGYTNGKHDIVPEYYEVGKGKTGYEEVARVIFNEEKISVEDMCKEFLMRLNPKKVYTEEEKMLRENQSKILFVDYRDEEAVRRAFDEINSKYGNNLLTKIEAVDHYYRAEEEHQHYFKRHPEEAACAIRK